MPVWGNSTALPQHNAAIPDHQPAINLGRLSRSRVGAPSGSRSSTADLALDPHSVELVSRSLLLHRSLALDYDHFVDNCRQPREPRRPPSAALRLSVSRPFSKAPATLLDDNSIAVRVFERAARTIPIGVERRYGQEPGSFHPIDGDLPFGSLG